MILYQIHEVNRKKDPIGILVNTLFKKMPNQLTVTIFWHLITNNCSHDRKED